MTPRSLLLVFPLFLACLPACGSAGDGAGGSAPSAASGGKSSRDSGSGAASNAAGASEATGTPNSYAPPATAWNSAKSALVTDAQLQSEYAAWQDAHVQACPNGSAIVMGDEAALSQGIGYGMLLAAAMGQKAQFDAFFRYYQEHLDKDGLMNWSTLPCEAPGNNNSNAATDADLDVAMALVQASALWPNGGYLAKARDQASKILQFETDLCGGRRVLRPGDAFGGCSDPVTKKITPSSFAPGYYKVFAHDFPEQAVSWAALGDGSYQLYAIYQARMNNLVPDASGPDGSDIDDVYGYEACRTPWRVAIDYAWTGDSRAKAFMQNVSSWVELSGGLPKAAQQQNSAFIGAFALAGGYEQGKFEGYVSSWLGAEMDDTPYYQGSLRVLYLLVAAGKFSSTL